MAQSTPWTMTAIEIVEPGGPEVLTPVQRPAPHPGISEILIEVHAAGLNRPDLRDPPLVARLPPEWVDSGDKFAFIQQRDVLLHHPYDSFGVVLDFLRNAAEDPKVLAVKMTLYRAGSNAEAVRLLVHAAEMGKQVAVSIEIKARFDEENNIAWAKALERAGAHVFFGRAASTIVRPSGTGRHCTAGTATYSA